MAKTGQGFIGGLTSDANRNPVQVGNQFQTNDNTGTPQNSPLSYSTTVLTLAVPDNAIQVTFMPTTDMRYSDLLAMTRYDVVRTNVKELIPCARMSNIYIVRDSADGSLNFKFITL